MSRVRIVALILLSLVCFCGCQKEANLDVDALVKQLLTEVINQEMLEISPGRLGNFYPTVAPGLFESLTVAKVYLCAEAVLADEIAVFQVKDVRDLSQLQAAFREHYQERVKIFSDYAPHEADRIQKRASVAQGKWLITVICDNPSRAEEIIKAALK